MYISSFLVESKHPYIIMLFPWDDQGCFHCPLAEINMGSDLAFPPQYDYEHGTAAFVSFLL